MTICQLFSGRARWASFLMMLAASATQAAEVDLKRLPPPAAKTVDFARDVYPLLKAHCLKCHKGAKPSSGFRLDQRAELLGETSGKAVVRIGASDQSRLIHLVSGLLEGEVMPPKGKRLTAEQVGVLRAWIDRGLPWDDALLPPAPAKSDHWAFQPAARPAVPRVPHAP